MINTKGTYKLVFYIAAALFGVAAYLGVFKASLLMNDYLILRIMIGLILISLGIYVIQHFLNKTVRKSVIVRWSLFIISIIICAGVGIVHGEAVLKNTVEVIDLPQFDNYEEYFFSEGLAAVCQGDKYGYMNENGDLIISLQYDEAEPFFCGRAKVCINKKYGYIDRNGEEVIPCVFHDGSDFSDHITSVEDDNGIWKLVDRNGKDVLFDYDEIGNQILEFHEGYAVFCDKKNKLYGYVNRHGCIVVPAVYTDAFPVSEGLAFVSGEGSKNVFVDMNGVESSYSVDIPYGASFRQGKTVAYRLVEGNGILIDQEGNILQEFPERMSVIRPAGEWFSYLDTEQRKYGCVDGSGNVMIKPMFDWIGTFVDDITKVMYNGKIYYVQLK